MDLGNHRDGHASMVGCLTVDPVRGPSVPLDFQRLDKVCGHPASFDQVRYLRPGHRVSLDGRGVVDVVDPDLLEDMVGFDRSRETPKMGVEELDFLVDPSEEFLSCGTSQLFPTLCFHCGARVAKTRLNAKWVVRLLPGSQIVVVGKRRTGHPGLHDPAVGRRPRRIDLALPRSGQR